MTRVRLVFYVIDPFADLRQPLGALISEGGQVRFLRVPNLTLPYAARANAERVLIDLEAATALDPLPVGAGAHVVAGPSWVVPATVDDPPAWVRDMLLARAA
jgi:hypothetical protein